MASNNYHNFRVVRMLLFHLPKPLKYYNILHLVDSHGIHSYIALSNYNFGGPVYMIVPTVQTYFPT